MTRDRGRLCEMPSFAVLMHPKVLACRRTAADRADAESVEAVSAAALGLNPGSTAPRGFL